MSDTRDCLNCSKSVAVDEMARYPSGGLKKICLACDAGKTRAKGEAVTTSKKTLADISVIATVPKLCVPAGYGIEASIFDGILCMQQGEDSINLSKDEARRLFQAFGEWAAA